MGSRMHSHHRGQDHYAKVSDTSTYIYDRLENTCVSVPSNAVEVIIVIYYCQADQGHSVLTLLHSEWPKHHRVLAVLRAIGLMRPL